MARVFQNPANNHTESVSGWSHLWTLLFGLIYLLVRGLWGHVAIMVAVIIFCFSAFGPPGTIFVIGAWLIYAIVAPNIVAARYLRVGWREVIPGQEHSPAAGSVAASSQRASDAARSTGPAVDERTCPFCAEVIKRAAIKCKHCGSDLSSTGGSQVTG